MGFRLKNKTHTYQTVFYNGRDNALQPGQISDIIPDKDETRKIRRAVSRGILVRVDVPIASRTAKPKTLSVNKIKTDILSENEL